MVAHALKVDATITTVKSRKNRGSGYEVKNLCIML
jgi:hypothetical protein